MTTELCHVLKRALSFVLNFSTPILPQKLTANYIVKVPNIIPERK